MRQKSAAASAISILARLYKKQATDKSVRTLENVCPVVLESIQDDTPFISGRLQRGWQWEMSGLTATWYNDVPYASEVEFNHGGGMLRVNTAPYSLAKAMQKAWREA